MPVKKEEIVTNSFLLEQSPDQKLAIYYAPVEYINEKASLLIVGITPGFYQMQQAYSRIVQLKGKPLDNEQLLHQAKLASSYQGPMRKNLIHMLDELGLHHYFGIASSADLFGPANHVVHTTGLIPYPVFYKGKNYTGSTPSILSSEILKKYVIQCFINDLSRLNNPLIIPLGVTVSTVLQYLADHQLIDNKYILTGFPHPSGANGHRVKQFTQNKKQMNEELAIYFGKK
ncbi:hypothetical protein WMZ97_15445 [Lentibacillus sp. N15]